MKDAVLTLTLAVPGNPLVVDTQVSAKLIDFTYGDVLKSIYGLLKKELETAHEANKLPEKGPARCPFDHYEEPCPVHSPARTVPITDAPIATLDNVKDVYSEGIEVGKALAKGTCSPRCPVCNPAVIDEPLYAERKPEPTVRQTDIRDFVGRCGLFNCSICFSELATTRLNP